MKRNRRMFLNTRKVSSHAFSDETLLLIALVGIGGTVEVEYDPMIRRWVPVGHTLKLHSADRGKR